MDARYFVTPESICITGSSSSEERIALNPSSTTPPFLMKISRSRWYSFLRRVFHYQNGSGLDLGPNPLDSKKWMVMELMALGVQIIATSYVLIISRDERPVWPMRIWVTGYAFGCFVSLILLFLRCYYRAPGDGSSDIEQQSSSHESRHLQCVLKCKTSLELVFAIWFVMGNVWAFDTRFGSHDGAPKLHLLCIFLLSWNAITYSFPFILFLLLCCCVPLIGTLSGYNMNSASLSQGATQEEISTLPTWKYGSVLEPQNPKCCICLGKYREKEEIRQLPCRHLFHVRCVDEWLKIISCCPLCKQGIEK